MSSPKTTESESLNSYLSGLWHLSSNKEIFRFLLQCALDKNLSIILRIFSPTYQESEVKIEKFRKVYTKKGTRKKLG